nr:MAG TPA: hypothetical protein [Bacteriophage sp.]
MVFIWKLQFILKNLYLKYIKSLEISGFFLNL